MYTLGGTRLNPEWLRLCGQLLGVLQQYLHSIGCSNHIETTMFEGRISWRYHAKGNGTGEPIATLVSEREARIQAESRVRELEDQLRALRQARGES